MRIADTAKDVVTLAGGLQYKILKSGEPVPPESALFPAEVSVPALLQTRCCGRLMI